MLFCHRYHGDRYRAARNLHDRAEWVLNVCVFCVWGRRQKTMPTSECGTHGYMAPEVLKPDVPYGLGADWFSLGCTVYVGSYYVHVACAILSVACLQVEPCLVSVV